MIDKEPKDFIPLEVPLRVEVNPRMTVRIQDGMVIIYSRGNTIKMTEWEFGEVSFAHATQRIREITVRHKKDH